MMKKEKRRKRAASQPESDPTHLAAEGAASDDPFSLLAGGDEGGFLTLEEFDELEYGSLIGGVLPDLDSESKSKKRKRGKVGSGDGDACVDGGNEKKKTKKKSRRNSKKEKRRKKMVEEEGEENGGESEEGEDNGGESAEVNDDDEPCPELVPILLDENAQSEVGDDSENDLLLKDDEVYAWNDLRLHPLLIKSIRRLGFRDPTPIQKACIPAAAHQGKDVIGAAETGSGKTLAFGLPILQRLLEEREKAARSLQSEEKAVETFMGGPLRALIITPTRELALQVSDHLKAAAKNIDIRVVPIVGGMSSEKQERLLKRRPEIIVGTPGRLWELMSGGNEHLVELHSLSFFVLDEADRMIENGHFRELQSIIDMLPVAGNSVQQCSESSQTWNTIPTFQRRKRQTFVFSATIALSNNFRKKLKKSSSSSKSSTTEGLNSIETLSERAGMRADAAIVDLTNAAIMADKLEESFVECREEDKEAYLYYILSVHGQGRTIVFFTSIAAIRRISALLRILGINVWTLHAQMQQRARLKESLQQFPLDDSYMPEVMSRLTLARQIDKMLRKNSQENVKKNWLERNAESMELTLEDSGSEEEVVNGHKQKKLNSLHLKRLQQELKDQLAGPLQPKNFSRRFLAGAGVSLLFQKQLEELSKRKSEEKLNPTEKKRAEFLVIGQDCVEPLEALRTSGREVHIHFSKSM